MSNSFIAILQEAILQRKKQVSPKNINSIAQVIHKRVMETAIQQVIQATTDLSNTSSDIRDGSGAIKWDANGPYAQSTDLEDIVTTIKQLHEQPKHDRILENLLIQYAQAYASEVNKNIVAQRAYADDKLNHVLDDAEQHVTKAVNEIPTPPQRVKLLTRFPPFGRSGGKWRRKICTNFWKHGG